MGDSSKGGVLTDVEGTVKWFDPRKGFGFIVGPEGQDIFVHYTQIAGDGFRVLKDNAKVIYSAELGDRGWHATAVKRVEAPNQRPDVRVRAVSAGNRNTRRSGAESGSRSDD
jgi:CspA family cold shock protein